MQKFIENNLKLGLLLITIFCFSNKIQSQEYDLYYLDADNVTLNSVDEDTLISLRGLYVKGQTKPKDGLWTVYFDKSYNQKAFQVRIKNERINGERINWYRNGKKKSEGQYIDWVCVKDCRRYYESGQIQYERLCEKNNDIEKRWFKSGELKKETHYKNQAAIKTIEYFKSGKVKREYFYKKSESYMEGYEPFIGVEYSEEGQIIGSLNFYQKIVFNSEDYTEQVIRTIELDSLNKKK